MTMRCYGFLFAALVACDCVGVEIDELEKKIRAVVTNDEWIITSDTRSISLTRKNIRWLNPLGLPGLPSEDKIWEEFSLPSDYRITITFDTKLSPEEYQALSRLREQLLAARMQDVPPGTKESFGVSMNAQGLLRLPQYQSGRFAVHFYSSGENFFHVRPADVMETKKRIVEVLEANCVRYDSNDRK